MINLNQSLAPDSAADEADVRRIKKALNRLGYYTPHDKTGITGMTDEHLFDAIKAFQRDHALPATGRLKPGDGTLNVLSDALENAPDGHYIWRTVGDGHVRDAHKVYEGTVRTWHDAPDPGDDYNCRCWAEIVKWKWHDFLSHYWKGKGKPVTLDEIGLLDNVVALSNREIFPKVKEQVIELARQSLHEKIFYTTENHYDFREVSFPFGDVVVRTETNGKIKREDQNLIIDAEVIFKFEDEFTDIADIREIILGTSSTDHLEFEKFKWSEFEGKAYMIKGRWKIKFRETLQF